MANDRVMITTVSFPNYPQLDGKALTRSEWELIPGSEQMRATITVPLWALQFVLKNIIEDDRGPLSDEMKHAIIALLPELMQEGD